MKKGDLKYYFFWFILLCILVIAIEIVGYAGMYFKSRSFDFLSNRNYFLIRDMLLGDTTGSHLPRYLSQPYLGYIPYPGYQKYNVQQHNTDGYRGAQIPLAKDGKYRILCMGGSTTYGFGVKLPTETYPAQLETLANSYVQNDSLLSKKYTGAEVLNAGLEAGTSAEELQQFLFKYHYYFPDMVIVGSGGNDAILEFDNKNFQLDYTDYRRIMFHVEPLPKKSRWLLKSNFLSFVIIYFFYEEQLRNDNAMFNRTEQQPYCHWTDVKMDSLIEHNNFTYYPFYNNHLELTKNIMAQNAQLVDLEFALNPNFDRVKGNTTLINHTRLNNKIIAQIANAQGGKFVPFCFDSIPNKSFWVDDCHLTAEGEALKAQIIFKQIKALIK